MTPVTQLTVATDWPPSEHYLTLSIYSIIAQSMPMLRDRSMIPYLSQEGFKRKLPAKQCGDLIFICLSDSVTRTIYWSNLQCTELEFCDSIYLFY